MMGHKHSGDAVMLRMCMPRFRKNLTTVFRRRNLLLWLMVESSARRYHVEFRRALHEYM